MKTEIKKSMMRIYSSDEDERYILLEAEHKGDIETENKRGRDGVLWDVFDAIPDVVRDRINDLPNEEILDAICRAIDPERKLFQYVKWFEPTFQHGTFVVPEIKGVVDVEVEVLYAEEAAAHCARYYEPAEIDINYYVCNVISHTIENVVDYIAYDLAYSCAKGLAEEENEEVDEGFVEYLSECLPSFSEYLVDMPEYILEKTCDSLMSNETGITILNLKVKELQITED